MRICMVMSVPLPSTEGIGSHVWNLSCFLSRKGHIVQVITRGERGKPSREVLDGITVWRPRFYPIYPYHVHLHRLFVQHLVGHLEDQVDIFHLHSPLPPPVQTRRPQLVTVHTPLRGEARNIPIESPRSLLVRAQIPVGIRIERQILDHADRVAVYARSVAEELGQYGLKRSQIEMVGNGVDPNLFRPIEGSQARQPAGTYVFAAARLDVRKGFEDLIEAMRYVGTKFPGVCLYVAGAGPLKGRLRAQVERLGLDGVVHFLGHIDKAQMVALYQEATVFAHPAHYEGLPTVLLEAMACGRAVVSTAVSGALDVIRDGVNGFLVPARSPQRLAEAICRLLQSADLRDRLGAAARRTVEGHFSWHVVGRKYIECYQELLN